MDSYNRWLMRASGERVHQAQGAAEAAAFAMLDWLRQKNLLTGIITSSKTDNSKTVDDLVAMMGRVIQQYTPAPVREPTHNVWYTFVSGALIGGAIVAIIAFPFLVD